MVKRVRVWRRSDKSKRIHAHAVLEDGVRWECRISATARTAPEAEKMMLENARFLMSIMKLLSGERDTILLFRR